MRTVVLTLAAVMLLGSSVGAEEVRVKLIVTERAGVKRMNEPVTFGVPLPAGAVTDPQTLALTDEQGKAIPAGFRVAQWWIKSPGRGAPGRQSPARERAGEKSARWVHVSCLLSVPAKGTRTLTLTNVPPGRDSEGAGAVGDLKDSPLKVELDAKSAKATIVTGPVKLVLDAHRPGVIESASLGDGQVIRGDAGSRAIVGGKTFTEIDPATAAVEVLEAGPMRTVVLLRGKFKDSNSAGAVGSFPGKTLPAEGKNAGPGLIYEARVCAYAGSPRVAIDYTIINKIGSAAAHKIDLEDLSLNWPLNIRSGLLVFGRPEKVQTTGFKSEISGTITQLTEGSFGFAFTGQTGDKNPDGSPQVMGWGGGTDRIRDLKPLDIGWIGFLATGSQPCFAVGVRDFWQTYPKALRVVSEKTGLALQLGLYPKEAGKAQELFIGQARTHRITLFFHDGKTKPEELNAIFTAANAPLMPVPEPAWYCQQTRVYGPMVSSDADYGEFSRTARHYDSILGASMDSILKQLDEGRTSRGVTQDSYGWLNWGDTFFRKPNPGWGPTFPEPHKNLSWNGNYYDYGFAMICQFARTGQWRYLQTGLRAGAYTADVFTTHYFPDPTRIGACHYCPPRYHAATDDGRPYVSGEFNHAKAASILARWQMLGDWWARQAAMEVFNCALNLRGADNAGWRQCRGNGHRLRILWLAYHFTGEKKYQDRAWELVKKGIAHINRNTEFDKRKSQRFMVGIALEGMILQYWDRPDPTLLQTIRFVADYAVKAQKLNGYTANMAMAYGFLWQRTRDPYYLKTMIRLLKTLRALDQAKIFGQTFRSTPWALGHLYEAAEKGVKLPPPATQYHRQPIP